jgi:hypothetical protein
VLRLAIQTIKSTLPQTGTTSMAKARIAPEK